MEFEDVDERIEWEARRVAAAFGVQSWTRRISRDGEDAEFEGYVRDIGVCWVIKRSNWRLDMLHASQRAEVCGQIVDGGPIHWFYEFNPKYSEFFACALYRLGIEDEDVIDELNHPLTAHEKLELRLSMPREFWPQKWLDEEAKER